LGLAEAGFNYHEIELGPISNKVIRVYKNVTYICKNNTANHLD